MIDELTARIQTLPAQRAAWHNDAAVTRFIHEHWVLIQAFKVASSAPNVTPDKYLKTEAATLKVGLAELHKEGRALSETVGEVTEVYVSGKSLSSLDKTQQIDVLRSMSADPLRRK
jgi:hypothetical protein